MLLCRHEQLDVPSLVSLWGMAWIVSLGWKGLGRVVLLILGTWHSNWGAQAG